MKLGIIHQNDDTRDTIYIVNLGTDIEEKVVIKFIKEIYKNYSFKLTWFQENGVFRTNSIELMIKVDNYIEKRKGKPAHKKLVQFKDY